MWLLLVTVATIGYCGYYWLLLLLLATVATIRYCGYYWLLWLLLVTVATTGYCDYYRLLRQLPVTVAATGYCGYNWLLWLLLVTPFPKMRSSHYPPQNASVMLLLLAQGNLEVIFGVYSNSIRLISSVMKFVSKFSKRNTKQTDRHSQSNQYRLLVLVLIWKSEVSGLLTG
jgi:hypothetical protein